MSSDENDSGRQTPFAAPPGGTAPLSPANESWLAQSRLSLDDAVTLARVRADRPELTTAAVEVARQDGVKARLCRWLAFEGPSAVCTYDDLQSVVSVSRRTLRYHVADLAERGLVDRDSHPHGTTVSWPDEATYLLVSETLDAAES